MEPISSLFERRLHTSARRLNINEGKTHTEEDLIHPPPYSSSISRPAVFDSHASPRKKLPLPRGLWRRQQKDQGDTVPPPKRNTSKKKKKARGRGGAGRGNAWASARFDLRSCMDVLDPRTGGKSSKRTSRDTPGCRKHTTNRAKQRQWGKVKKIPLRGD